jgi:GTP cyclohydrolase I
MNNAANKEVVISERNSLVIENNQSELSSEEKINAITYYFKKIMETLGLDLDDDSLKDTPARVANMYVKEIFSGLDSKAFPAISLFKNTYQYREMLLEKNIEVYSHCDRYFLPFAGKAHIAYIPGEMVIGLSKLNRIVKYFACRPQGQEQLTIDIANSLKEVLQTEDVAVLIEARHLCVAARGVEDTGSATCTSYFGGRFNGGDDKALFFNALRKK